MKVLLTPSWELTNEHATSAYAVPVLVDRHEGRAYGRGGNTLTRSELDRDDGGLGCHENEARACFHGGRGGILGTFYGVGSHRQAST